METIHHFNYTLDPGSSKFLCPECGAKKFVLYVDSETGDYLPEGYGKCERVNSCGYHNWPTGSQKTTNKKFDGNFYYPDQVLNNTLKEYENNTLFINLSKTIPLREVRKVFELYSIGTVTNRRWHGSTTFPYIDVKGNINAIQVVKFDDKNHRKNTTWIHELIDWYYRKEQRWWVPVWNERLQKYVKQQDINPPPDWLQKYQKQDKKLRCLFGEHLLNKFPDHSIGLCESPKTAIIGNLYYGDKLLWLSTFNLQGLNYEKCKVLEGRKVYLFPDLDAHKTWKQKAGELNYRVPKSQFVIKDFIYKKASSIEKEKGLDLADYLLEFNWREFQNKL